MGQKGWQYSVSVSHLEIYNENLRDLLAPPDEEPRKLDIKHVENGRTAAGMCGWVGVAWVWGWC